MQHSHAVTHGFPARPLRAEPSLRGSGKLFSSHSRLSLAPPSVLEKVEIGWDMGATDHLFSLASDTGRLAANERLREGPSSDDREAELAASLLAQRLLLLAVLLAALLALLHGRRRFLVALLLLDLALLAVDEAFAIVFGRRRRRRQRIAQFAGLLAVCQLRWVVILAPFREASVGPRSLFPHTCGYRVQLTAC